MVNSPRHGGAGMRTSSTSEVTVGIHTVCTPYLQSPNSFQLQAKDRPFFLEHKINTRQKKETKLRSNLCFFCTILKNKYVSYLHKFLYNLKENTNQDLTPSTTCLRAVPVKHTKTYSVEVPADLAWGKVAASLEAAFCH